MLSFFSIALIGAIIYWTLQFFLTWLRNIEVVKGTGFQYVCAPVSGDFGYAWNMLYQFVVPPLVRIFPFLADKTWIKVIHPHHSWILFREIHDKLGTDTYFRASPGPNYLVTTDAELVVQITQRKNDFVKPIELYSIVDMYGPSILTLDGDNWKRHKKIVAPAFSEKSNALVWEESLRQANGMTEYCRVKFGSQTDGSVLIPDTAEQTLQLALHVISGAGFGVPQLWEGQDEASLGSRIVPGFNTEALVGTHKLTFLHALHTMVGSVIWMALFPVPVLRWSPFKIHKDVLAGYVEMGDYFRELAEYKIQKTNVGETDVGTMDLMGPLVKASSRFSDPEKGSDYLTPEEVTANSWIFLFAGHETSANIMHFALVFLATNVSSQQRLQADVDNIAGGRPSTDWTYTTDMRRFYNSMVGAVQNETLRLIPPVTDIPKITRDKVHTVVVEGREHTIPKNTFIHLDVVNTQRNPKYYPHKPSKITNNQNNLDDFVPERWLPGYATTTTTMTTQHTQQETDSIPNSTATKTDGLEEVSFETSDAGSLYSPPPGSFIAFSSGVRGCPGRRFAQVEITAVIAAIFNQYSVELDVREWASDEEVEAMDDFARIKVYEKAMAKARRMIRGCFPVITLKNYGYKVPVRLVKRGSERFACLASSSS